MPKVLKKYFQGGHVGFDKKGSPIWVDPAPKMDWSGNTPPSLDLWFAESISYLIPKLGHNFFICWITFHFKEFQSVAFAKNKN